MFAEGKINSTGGLADGFTNLLVVIHKTKYQAFLKD